MGGSDEVRRLVAAWPNTLRNRYSLAQRSLADPTRVTARPERIRSRAHRFGDGPHTSSGQGTAFVAKFPTEPAERAERPQVLRCYSDGMGTAGGGAC
jgi:hypothetical protein